MKHFTTLITAAVLSVPASFAMADGDSHGKPSAPAATAATPLTDGEIKKVDKDAGKVTIKHGEIKNLDMPAMTMVFRVKEPAMLDQLRVGDKIQFAADKVNGAFTVMKVEAAK